MVDDLRLCLFLINNIQGHSNAAGHNIKEE